ncbi:MAG: LPS export ABC transporter periplasmic protein LptC [Syntrophobacteraceae bacterium]|nr:LPS export ABC transporter periplasmic protein LptC [Syntrophobacteraceae bacterium]
MFVRKFTQGVVLLVALGLSAMLLAGIWKGKTQKDHRIVPVSDASEAEMRLSDMEYTEMQDGKRLWTLKASEAKYYQDQQKTLLTSVHLTLFLEEGDEIRLESREGILYAGTKNIELWNSVHARLPRSYEMMTDRAFYEHERQAVYSETPIRLTGPDVELEGSSWEYRIPQSRAVVNNGVRATLILGPKKPPTKSKRLP